MKMVHSVFCPPPMSLRRNRSENTVMSSQKKIMKPKNHRNVQNRSRSG